MPIAAILLTVETSLGDHTLAGQTGVALLQRAINRPSSPWVQAGAIDHRLVPTLRDWLAKGVKQILLVRDDRPLLTAEALDRLVQQQQNRAAPLAVLLAPDGCFAAGCGDPRWLVEQIGSRATPLTLDDLARTDGATTLSPANPTDCLAVDGYSTLAEAEGIIRQRINTGWMEAGVQMIDPATTYIHAAVVIGRGTTILPNTHLWGKTSIGEGCRIGPNSIVAESSIGDQCTIIASVVEHAVMEDDSDIGPFGHLRKGARVCRGAHMGNFGEMKNSILGPNAKMGHFGYLGDTIVGEDVNIGAGTVTCNFDGVNKNQTIIQDGAFIGSDTMLVAPVEIGAGARIGAGSVVTHDVPAGAVAYGAPARVRESAEEKEEKDSESAY